MKKIGIFLAALIIALFLVGTVVAMKEVCPPDQREKFCEESAVQGVGYIFYEKTIMDKAIAVDVYEKMEGDTGENGSFAMTISEVLNEGMRLNSSHYNGDPIVNASFDSFRCEKMVQFESGGEPVTPFYGVSMLEGEAEYKSSRFNGGIGAEVRENYYVSTMQKEEATSMKTTATYMGTTPADQYHGPYNAQQLEFSTRNAFVGQWGTNSQWKKVCTKDIKHTQFFAGEFQVDKTLVFKEEVTKPCKGDVPCICGDC